MMVSEHPPDLSGRYEQREWILLLRIQQAALRHLLDLLHALFLVTGTTEGASLCWVLHSSETKHLGRKPCAYLEKWRSRL